MWAEGQSATATPPPAPSGRVSGPAPAATAPAELAQSGWTVELEAGPPARRDHSLTAVPAEGALYVFGGRSHGNPRDDLWVFDPQQGRWSEVPVTGARPPARYGHNALFDQAGRRLIVALGQAGSTFFNDVWAFDPATSIWRELGPDSPDRPSVRYGSAGAYDRLGNRFFISHGFTNQGRFDDTWTFDLGAEVWSKVPTSGPVPIKRCLTRAAWDPAGRQLLLFGGQADQSPFLGDFWALDPDKGTWIEKRPAVAPSPRTFYGASFDEAARRWYLIGGNTAAGPVGDGWVYDVAGDTWTRLAETPATAPPARFSLDVATTTDRLYLFGGNDRSADLSDVWSRPLA
ncbi:MAG TPA: kelch repeat-containing protein [Dehalococcoidia bacterium]|nr:kelch repeat-containing protein [Dehalococcoidia bacterium]